MTNLNLQNYGVSNLETREMKITNGGHSIWDPSCWIHYLSDFASDFASDFVDGFNAGSGAKC